MQPDQLCVYCGSRADVLDHVVPRTRGGPDTPFNLVVACAGCNSSKSDKLPSEWKPRAELPELVLAIEARVSAGIAIRFRSRRGSTGYGLSDEYITTLAGLFDPRFGDPTDFEVVAAARRAGFDPEELWRDVGHVVTMRDDLNYDARWSQLRALAGELRRSGRRRA